MKRSYLIIFLCLMFLPLYAQQTVKTNTGKPNSDEQTVKEEHALIGVTASKEGTSSHTSHPDAQWYPDAGLGLFIHWGLSSVKAMNISWPMIPGRPLAQKHITDSAERARIIRESDYNLNGKVPEITPNEYWAMAKDFNPQKYDPYKWMKAAKEAGFTYVVLTTRHHEGFALWPSAYGNFNTKNYMGGRDLLKDYVDACRKNGLKVGFYYSPPDWYFDRDYMSFLYHGARKTNPEFPSLDADLKPRTSEKSDTEKKAHEAEYGAMVKGQVEELLTRYGKIDVLWFDGRPPIPEGNKCITIERIRELQPGIVMNPRMHGKGDFITYERKLNTDKVAEGWAEFCNTWTTCWAHMEIPFRSNGYILGQLVKSRSLGINYLLGVGPMATGELCDGVYSNMGVVGGWMKKNAASVVGAKPLPSSETASVPATTSGSTRYLFLIPEFKDNGAYDDDMLPLKDENISLSGITKPKSIRLTSDGSVLDFVYANGKIDVKVPAAKRSKLVDVIKVEL